MATRGVTAATEALKDRFGPAFETLEENMKEAKRAIIDGRRAAEDFVAETASQVRRHPWRSVVVAAGAGALAGCLVGCALGRRAVRR